MKNEDAIKWLESLIKVIEQDRIIFQDSQKNKDMVEYCKNNSKEALKIAIEKLKE